MTVIAKLTAVIDANTSRFDAGIKRTGDGLRMVSGGMAGAGQAATGMSGLIAEASQASAAKVGLLASSVASLKRSLDSVAAGRLNEIGKTISATALNAAAGVSALALGSAKMAGDFDQSMRNVDSIAKLSASSFDALSKSVLAMVHDKNIKQSADDLAKGLYDIYSSGATGKTALNDLRAAAIGASAGMTDTATATHVLMGVLNSGIGGVTSARQAMDVLFQEVNFGVNTFEQLAQQIGPLLPLSARAGISIQELSAAMAGLTIPGTDAAEAATQLQGIISHLIGATGEAAKEMDFLGIKHGLTAIRAEGLKGALENVAQATKHHQDALHDIFPEIRSYIGLLALTNNGGEKFTSLLNQMSHASDGQGAAMEANNRQMAGVKAQFEKLAAEIQADMIPAGLKLLPVLRSFEPLLKDVADSVIGVLKAFGGLPEPIQKTILVMGSAQIAANVLGIKLGSLGVSAFKLVGGFNGIKMSGAVALNVLGSMATEGTAAAAGLGLVAVAAAGIAADVYLIKKDWDLAAEAMANYHQAAAQNAAADVARAALNNTGDPKRNMLGAAAQIAYEQGEIKKAIAGRKQLIDSLKADDGPLSAGGNYRDQIAKAMKDIDALNAAYAAQDKNRRALLANAAKVDYTSHSAAFNAMSQQAVKAVASAAGDNAGGDVKAAMAARAAAAKQANQLAKELGAIYSSQLESLGKQTYLLGKNGQVAQVQADILYGSLGKLNRAEQSILLTKAAQYDAAKLQQDIAGKLQASQDAASVASLSKVKQAVIDAAGGYREWIKLGQQGRDAFAKSFGELQGNTNAQKAGDLIKSLSADVLRAVLSVHSLGAGAAQALGREAAGGAEEFAKMLGVSVAQVRALGLVTGATSGSAGSLIAKLAASKAYAEGAAGKIAELRDQLLQAGNGADSAAAQMQRFLDSLKQTTGADLGYMDLGKLAGEALAAAQQIDTQAAKKQLDDWQHDLGRQIDTARQRIAGTYDPAKAALADWAAQNQDALGKITAAGESAASVLASVGAQFSLEQQAAAAERMRDMIRSAKDDWAQMTARNPFEAWKAALGPMPGVDPAQLKELFDFQQKVQLVKDAASGIRDTLVGAFNDAFQNGAKTFFSSVVQGFNKMLRDMAVQQLTNRAMQALTGLLGGAIAGSFGGGSGGFGTPGIAPSIASAAAASGSSALLSSSSLFSGIAQSVTFGGARAAGGPITAGLPYLVGEKGPEIVVPRSSGTVIPNHQLATAGTGSGQGGDTYHQNIYVTVQSSGGNKEMDRRSGQQAGQAFLSEIQRAQRRNG